MRNSVNILLKAALAALAVLFGGAGALPRTVDDHSYRKHVLESAHVHAEAANEGMRWSALSAT
jgi:hypothetical protein